MYGAMARDESGMQQVSCPRVEQQPRLQPSIPNHTAISVARAGFSENSSSTMCTQPVVVLSRWPSACSRRATTTSVSRPRHVLR